MYDLIVIGGGPAGLTATIYAIRKHLNVLMVSQDLGGKTNYHMTLPWLDVSRVIRGQEVINQFRGELEALDFARHMEPVEEVLRHGDAFAVRMKGGGEMLARAVIVATGVRQFRLDVPGEKEFLGRGVSYSAISYAPVFFDRTAMVVGNGELAVRAAGELATIARHTYLVCAKNNALSSPLGYKLRGSTHVSIMENCQVTEIMGDQYVRSATVKDAAGREKPLEVDGIFVELGLAPNSQVVAKIAALDPYGRIKVDFSNRTNIPGLFAAGDVTAGFAEQVLIAVGDGAKAALAAYDYLLPML